MENILECGICLEKYNSKEKIPRMLKCGHTFCANCLKELIKINNNLDNFIFIKCPIDKTIGHNNTNIEEIPINRIILDILDYNGFAIEKLSLSEEKSNEKMQYINKAKDKLKNLEKIYNSSYNTLRAATLHFISMKNNCIGDIIEHCDRMISMLVNKKAECIYQLEKFGKDRLNSYNQSLECLEKYKEAVQIKLEKIEDLKNKKLVSNISLEDEIQVLNNLGIENLDDREFQRELEVLIKEVESDYLPKLMIKNDCIYIILHFLIFS